MGRTCDLVYDRNVMKEVELPNLVRGMPFGLFWCEKGCDRSHCGECDTYAATPRATILTSLVTLWSVYGCDLGFADVSAVFDFLALTYSAGGLCGAAGGGSTTHRVG